MVFSMNLLFLLTDEDRTWIVLALFQKSIRLEIQRNIFESEREIVIVGHYRVPDLTSCFWWPIHKIQRWFSFICATSFAFYLF